MERSLWGREGERRRMRTAEGAWRRREAIASEKRSLGSPVRKRRAKKALQELLRIHVDHQVVSRILRQHFLHEAMQAAAVGGAGEELEAPFAAQALQRRRGRAGETHAAGERMPG